MLMAVVLTWQDVTVVLYLGVMMGLVLAFAVAFHVAFGSENVRYYSLVRSMGSLFRMVSGARYLLFAPVWGVRWAVAVSTWRAAWPDVEAAASSCGAKFATLSPLLVVVSLMFRRRHATLLLCCCVRRG